MLNKCRIIPLAMIAGAIILATGIIEASATVVTPTFEPGNSLSNKVEFSDGYSIQEGGGIIANSSDTTVVNFGTPALTQKSTRLEAHSNLMNRPSVISEVTLRATDFSEGVIVISHITDIELSLLADSDHMISTANLNRDEIFFKLKITDPVSAFDGEPNSILITEFVHAAYRTYPTLISNSIFLGQSQYVVLFVLGFVGFLFVKRSCGAYCNLDRYRPMN